MTKSNQDLTESIRFKFLSIISLTLFVGTLILSIIIAISEGKVLRNSLIMSGQSLASFIATVSKEPLLMKDSIQLDAIVNDANKDENIVYTVIKDEQGNLVTSQYASINYRSPRIVDILSRLSRNSELHDMIDAINKQEPVIELSAPIMIHIKSIGSVTIGMSGYKVHQQILKTILFVIALNLAVALILGVVLFMASRKVILDPLAALARAASAIAGGNLSTRVNIQTTGEVKTLVDSFNKMSADLTKTTVSKYYVDNIIKSMMDTLIVVSSDGKIALANGAACSLLGYDEEELVGQSFEMLLGDSAMDKHKIEEVFRGNFVDHVEITYLTKDGGNVPMFFSGSAMLGSDDRFLGAVFAATDITERKRMEEELRALSLKDELTGLYNRRGLVTFAEHLLKMANRLKRGIFLLYADLDNMKIINDTYGHQEGDKVLVEIANILKENYRNSDVVARIGGDEFVVVPVGVAGDDEGALAERLRKSIETNNLQRKRSYNLSLSAGIAFYDPENPCSIEELLLRGDRLMYEQKIKKRAELI
ncbi:MAG: diguanylate cyclase [Dissulfurispiraceae bacterium]